MIKKVTVDSPSVSVKDLTGKEIIGYIPKSDFNGDFCTLKKRSCSWGFAPITSTNTAFRFESNTMAGAIKDAIAAGRDVVAFDSIKDLATYITETY